MTTVCVADELQAELEAGHARFTYRLRVSSAAHAALRAEWDRCRWVWNQCVAESRAAHKASRECGSALLDRMLTGWRAEHEWLGVGASVPQQQTVRDFAKARAKALPVLWARISRNFGFAATPGEPRPKPGAGILRG